jgi:glycosyltransferase involved in cell wall biosynthesis
MPVITAVIPVFNRAHIVGRAIDSVLTQEVPSGFWLKILVVDDGSSDGLSRALQPYDHAVTCIRHSCNSGAAAARNSGIDAAEDGYLAFLDSDDVWLPGKLKRQLEFMHRDGWLASCHSFYMGRHGRLDVVSPSYKTGTLGLDDIVWGCFTGPGSTLICTRSVLREIGLLDTNLPRLEDWDWLLRYGLKYRLGFIAEPLTRTDPSGYANDAEVATALEILRAKHAGNLNAAQRRHFLAGMDVVMAGMRYRCGDRVGAIAAALGSILRAPFRNRALSAILHNRLA